MAKKLTKKDAVSKLWHLGNLSYKLKGVQKEMRQKVVEIPGRRVVFLASRRLGKSFTMSLIATEICARQKNSVVKYVCPKQKMVKTILIPIMREILKDCPDDLYPEYMTADQKYRFPNGSEIQFAGSDNGNIENLRGGYADLCILDEAGFIDDLNYGYHSVLAPTTTTTKGKIILASTPSRDPNHEFITDFVSQATAENKLIKYTIYDNPMFTKSVIQEIIDDYPMGEEDPAFRREYLCETTQDSSTMVIPEFNDRLEKDIIREPKKPAYYDAYVAGDPAATDLTFVLFAYYDFLKSQIVVLDELVMGGPGEDITTSEIADSVKRKEKLLFCDGVTGIPQAPFLRVMDNNNKILLNDLFDEHGLLFHGTDKKEKEAHINKVRMMLKQGNIIISPKCHNLKYHLKTAKWHKTHQGNIKGFRRVKGSSDGEFKAHHCDGVDALIYLVRNVDLNKNPYPNGYFPKDNDENMFYSQNKQESSQNIFMKAIANMKKN